MNDTPILQKPRQTWRDLADEHQALVILELEDAVATHRALLFEALALLHAANERDKRQRERLRRLVAELRALREGGSPIETERAA